MSWPELVATERRERAPLGCLAELRGSSSGELVGRNTGCFLVAEWPLGMSRPDRRRREQKKRRARRGGQKSKAEEQSRRAEQKRWDEMG